MERLLVVQKLFGFGVCLIFRESKCPSRDSLHLVVAEDLSLKKKDASSQCISAGATVAEVVNVASLLSGLSVPRVVANSSVIH